MHFTRSENIMEMGLKTRKEIGFCVRLPLWDLGYEGVGVWRREKGGLGFVKSVGGEEGLEMASWGRRGWRGRCHFEI